MLSTQALQTTAQQVNKQITTLTYLQMDKPGRGKPASFSVEPAACHAEELLKNLWFYPTEERPIYNRESRRISQNVI
jgi:hypothetical protein